MECVDFLEFQDALKKLRDVDDKIVYALNASVPSPSFRKEINPESSCKDLFAKLQESHSKREKAIQNCIKVTSEKIATLKQDNEGSLAAVKHLNKEQTKLRLLRSELGVEEVVRDRSLKLYHERCRGFFKPPNLDLE
ncbi:coiled-coil domain-containing protein 58 [Cimex lectularius]|uniref:Protein MIX23 n=1 Tax=Cimex lectularius TaxID=79782 RepID=A0A8I6RJG4_CIMLE|nr:coiled-coil domain-containing protein 58 [Cimex lectularius]